MTENRIRKQLAKQLTEILNEEVDPNRFEAKLVDDYGADSMDIVDIADTLEAAFEIEILDSEIRAVITFGDVLELVIAKKTS